MYPIFSVGSLLSVGHVESQVELQLSVFYKGPGAGRPLRHGVRTRPVLSRRSVI